VKTLVAFRYYRPDTIFLNETPETGLTRLFQIEDRCALIVIKTITFQYIKRIVPKLPLKGAKKTFGKIPDAQKS